MTDFPCNEPSTFLTIVSIRLSVSLISWPFSLLIGLRFLGVFYIVKSIEGVFSFMGVTIAARGKSFG